MISLNAIRFKFMLLHKLLYVILLYAVYYPFSCFLSHSHTYYLTPFLSLSISFSHSSSPSLSLPSLPLSLYLILPSSHFPSLSVSLSLPPSLSFTNLCRNETESQQYNDRSQNLGRIGLRINVSISCK